MADARELYFRSAGLENYDVEKAVEFGAAFIWDLTGPNPTDEDCAFCDKPEQQEAVSAFDIAVPLASGQVALKGVLGMMRPGYMLAVTREHVTSFAQLPHASLAEIDRSFAGTEEQPCDRLGYADYLRLEHGSDNVKSCGLGAGACAVRVHQHLIPDTGATAQRMMAEKLDW